MQALISLRSIMSLSSSIKCLTVVFIALCFSRFKKNSLLSSKELFNFQTPDPRAKVPLLTKKQKTGELSDDRAFRLSVFLIDSCKLFETKIQPNLLCKIPVKCFCRKVNSFLWGLRTLQISQRLKFWFNLMISDKLFFEKGTPSCRFKVFIKN